MGKIYVAVTESRADGALFSSFMYSECRLRAPWLQLTRSRGVILSPAVIPIALTVSWSKLTRAGVFCGAIGGACLGMLAWMIGCWKIYGTPLIRLHDPD